jgi:sialic acid synthase
MSTPFDEPSLDFLLKIDTDILKVASFDLGNVAFLSRMASSKKPIVISVGGGKFNHIKSSIDILRKHTQNIAILHCVSEYPCPHDKLGLSNIQKLKSSFSDCVVGLSDHFNGTLSGPIGYMMGARVFEKHVTLNRAWKGTDHSFALEPRGFESFVRDIKRVPEMLIAKNEIELGSEYVFKKLGKSVAAVCDIEVGSELTIDNLRGKIFATPGIPVRDMSELVGRIVKRKFNAGSKITIEDLE